MRIVNIYGPQNSGKSTNAQALARHFRCGEIQDGVAENEDLSSLRDGTLVLSIYPIRVSYPIGRLITIKIEDALYAIGLGKAESVRDAG